MDFFNIINFSNLHAGLINISLMALLINIISLVSAVGIVSAFTWLQVKNGECTGHNIVVHNAIYV